MSPQYMPVASKEVDDGHTIAEPVSPPRRSRAPLISAFLGGAVLAVLLQCCGSYLGLGAGERMPWSASSTDRGVGAGAIPSAFERYPSAVAPPIKAPRVNPWKNLDLDEAVELRKWLLDPAQGLNLTRSDKASDSDIWVHMVERTKPNKDLVIQYLEGEVDQVPVYANVIVHNSTSDSIIDYLVGPLPPNANTTMTPAHAVMGYHNFPSGIPLNARGAFFYAALGAAVKKLLAPIDDIIVDLFGESYQKDELSFAGVAPLSYDGEWRRAWAQLRRGGPGAWLRNLDLYFFSDLSGQDTQHLKILQIMHNGTVYPDVAAFRAAHERGETVQSLPDPDPSWASRTRPSKPVWDLGDLRGPRSISPDGARFRVDREQGYISWMGWTFWTSFERDMGLHLWDIAYNGSRIIYELSPQEALAVYSGGNRDPHQSNTVWLDGSFGMGALVRSVIPGYDCPEDATMLDAMVHESGTSLRKNAICVFEREAGRPISRHTAWVAGEMGAVKGYELVVRSVSTVGNYDYLFDYTFMLDGTIEIRVSASGYLQGGVWREGEEPYGHRIHGRDMGSLHDHIINYKIDFDIAGRKNSFIKIKLEEEEIHRPWGFDGTIVDHQQRIVRETIESEGYFNHASNGEGTYLVSNPSSLNAHGFPRSYAIHPGPLAHLTETRSKRTERQAEWAKHHLAVTARKETEQKSSSRWNINLPGKPAVDFGKFVNDESIEQQDIVVWANLGTHHIPRAEDAPTTLTNLASSYMLLSPYNYFDRDAAVETSMNAVLMNANTDGTFAVDEGVPTRGRAMKYEGTVGWKETGEQILPESREYVDKLGEMSHGLRAWA